MPEVSFQKENKGKQCLFPPDFDCRSSEYDRDSSRCTLSREDRRTQPEAFRTGAKGVDYVENQCARREYSVK